jgi:hypothetical protein
MSGSDRSCRLDEAADLLREQTTALLEEILRKLDEVERTQYS